MDFLSGGTTLGLSLKQCESNCGELIHVNKIDKVALNDLEKAVFSIQCYQSDSM